MAAPLLPTLYTLSVTLTGSLAVCGGALAYLRRVRLERPAIGTFNRRDIVVVFGFIVVLPVLYLHLPRGLVLGLLIVTFTAALSIGLRPLLSPARLWLAVGLLIGANLWIGRTMLGTVSGWQLSWAETDLIVVLTAIAVTNLYVQGGMRLRHVAWFALLLAVYDFFFILIVPLTNQLLEGFLGYPLNPSFGMRYGLYNATIGIGDLLVYGLFTIAAYKAYGRRAARLALGLVVVFGALVPSFAPLVFELTDARTDIVVPAQVAFGPVAFLAYLWLKRRYGRERTMQEFLASSDVIGELPAVVAAPAEVREPQPAPAGTTVRVTPPG